jgi:phosphoglucomutase
MSYRCLDSFYSERIVKIHPLILGFKFIGNTALNLVAEGYEVPFGYEEAIGYMFGSEIRDKDGVAASVSSYCNLTVHRCP